LPNYRDYRVPGGTYFFTVNLQERHSNDLFIRHIEAFRQLVKETRKRWPFHIDAWVVLPEHLHCVWTFLVRIPMASSRVPGPLNYCNIWIPARTPGPMGYNDQADPNVCTLLGDTPGPLGSMDYADPSLPRFGETVNLQIGRTADGISLSLGTGGQVSGNASGNITLKQLKAIFTAASDDYLQKVANDLNTDLAKYGLDSPLRRAHFFAQFR